MEKAYEELEKEIFSIKSKLQDSLQATEKRMKASPGTDYTLSVSET